MSRDDLRPTHEGEPRVVVRDRRRIDPTSGAVREPAPAPGPGTAGEPAAGPSAAGAPAPGQPSGQPAGPPDAQVAELTDTLQRLKAEYDNYRRRAEREKGALREMATGNVLYQLLPVLDDIERARAHGDLVGAFGVVGESLVTLAGKLGLERYAEPGEHFDPQVHEAVMQAEPAPEATEPVVAQVFRTGYRHAGRVLRPAQVSVSEPGSAGHDGADHDAAEHDGAAGTGSDQAGADQAGAGPAGAGHPGAPGAGGPAGPAAGTGPTEPTAAADPAAEPGGRAPTE